MSTGNRVEPDGEDKFGKPREHEPDFKPLKNRSCTDIVCCLLFLLFLAAYGVISAFAFLYGNPALLIYASDSNGDLCGQKELANKPYLFFFDLAQCAKVTITGFKCPTPQVCVESCPTYYWNWLMNDNEPDKMICLYGVNATAGNRSVQDLVSGGYCAGYIVPEAPLVGRCLPMAISAVVTYLDQGAQNSSEFLYNSTTFKEGMSSMDTVIGWVNAIFTDLRESWLYILIGLGVGALLSLIWLLLLRILAGIIVWLLLLSFVVLFGTSTAYTAWRFIDLNGFDDLGKLELTSDLDYYLNQAWFWLVLAIVSGLIFLIVFVLILFLRKRIRIAIKLIEQASKALGYMLEVLLFPLIPFVLHAAVITYFALLAAYLVTMNAENRSNSTDYINCNSNISQVNEACQIFDTYVLQSRVVSLLFNLFMAFWLFFFVTGLSQMTVAGSFASYYFAFRKPQDIPCCTVIRSFCRTLRYHVGTVAFGSLLIALVKFARALLQYVKDKTANENFCAKFLLKCMACCLWCLEKCLKFITKNAYIMTAIRGRNFCFSAKDAFFLIMRNVLRAFALDSATRFVLFVGEMVVVGSVGLLAYFFFTNQIVALQAWVPQLTYFYVPLIIAVLGTYIIASTFFSVYDMGVDTLFLCFLEDLEMNDGSPEKPYYMSKGLRKILGKKNRAYQAEMEEKSRKAEKSAKSDKREYSSSATAL